MANSGDDISDSLIPPGEQSEVQLAWEDMELEVSIVNFPAPKKVGKLKKLLQCIGIGRKDVDDGKGE